MTAVPETAGFADPPYSHTASGQPRKVGFEFEFGGVPLERAALLVREIFGGEYTAESTFSHRVSGSPHGDFTIEIDTSLLKDKRYLSPLKSAGIIPEKIFANGIEPSLIAIFSKIVPFEISTPPVSLADLYLVDILRERLRVEGALGTRSSILYAFGLHINATAASLEVDYLRDILRAFLLLYPWISKRVKVDLTRWISPYVAPFPDEYAVLIMERNYPGSDKEFFSDYAEHNPTRNRALDLYPLLATIDPSLLAGKVADKHLVKPRPAFHYRLPNCLIDDSTWTIAHEWNTWVGVEKLAGDSGKLDVMIQEYREAKSGFSIPFTDRWPDILQNYIGP